MYTVNVLMSTYNGEKYLREQIDSILSQSGVETHITIRDDGSKDRTKSILNEYSEKYRSRFSISCGDNIGCNNSFIKLVTDSDKNYDYFAFSDQDDVWKSEKLKHAIKMLNDNRQAHLYASSLFICDEQLNIKSKKDMSKYLLSLKSDFVRHRLSGCTMVFDKILLQSLIEVANYFSKAQFPSYDFITCVTGLLIGKVQVDAESFIYHRRLSTSLTAQGWGIKNRIKTERKIILGYADERYDIANAICKMIDEDKRFAIAHDDIDFIQNVSTYKNNAGLKFRLVLFKGFTSKNIFLDIESRIKILINNF